MDGFTTQLVSALASAILIPFAIWIINRRRAGPRRKAMAFGHGMMAFFAIGGLFFGIPFVLMMIDRLPGKGTDLWWVRTIFGGFALLSFGTFLDGLFRKVEWSERGVRMWNWQGKREAAWSEIEGFDYKPGLQYWRIALPRGAGFGFVVSMAGAHAFLDDAFRSNVPVTSNGKPIVMDED